MGSREKNLNKSEEIFALVARAKEGDEFAFEKLYNYYLTPIFRYIYFQVQSQQEAEDLTQIVFIKMWQALPHFQKQTNPFSAWLYSIARNTIIDYYRKKKKEIVLPEPLETFKKVPDLNPGPDQIREQNEKKEIVYQIINQLTEEQKEIIILKFINGLGNQEIASLLGKTEQAIRALQYRALKALRKKFKNLNLL